MRQAVLPRMLPSTRSTLLVRYRMGNRSSFPACRKLPAPGRLFQLIPVPSGGAFAHGKVDINTAAVDQLQQLNGVGPALAQRIIADRQANGPFKTVEDLKRVSGIGDKKFASLADSICVG